MTEPWAEEIEQVRNRLDDLIARADLGDDTRALAAEALEQLAVTVEEMQAQNVELILSRTDLEQERERYRDLFETAPDGYLVTDTQGVIREANSTACDLFGRSRRRLIGSALATLVEPKDRRAFYAHLSRVQQQGPGSHITINLSAQDHVHVPANLRATVGEANPGGGADIRWLIHDRRPELASEEIRLSEERLRELFDTAAVGIVLGNLDGTIVFANQHADAILDRQGAETTQAAWLRAVHPDDINALDEILRAARQDGESGSLRHRVNTSAAGLRWVDHHVGPFLGIDGSIDGFISTLTDVTPEQEAVMDLRRAREFTDAILDTVGALVVVIDPSGTIIRFNATCETVTGFSAEQVIGKPLMKSLLPVEDHDDLLRIFGDLGALGWPRTYESNWNTADGRKRRISWSNTALTSDDGTVQAIIGTGIDVTETRSLQARLAQAARLESIGRLAAGIAHDFNNTLTTLQLRLDRLAGRSLDSDSHVDLNEALTTIQRTQGLIGDLLSFSSRQELAPAPTDVNAHIKRVMPVLADLLGDTIAVELSLTTEPAIALIDPTRFDQILTNLTINARDALAATLTITTAVDTVDPDRTDTAQLAPGTYVRLTVTDDGVGISSGDLPHVFEPYFTTKPRGIGTGLGLATSYGTVAQTGGAITAASEPGNGTTFTILLPGAPSKAPGNTNKPTPTAEKRHRLVLVVDDDPAIRQVVVEELDRLDYVTLEAADGDQALSHLDSPVDLLLTDVQLPGINGVDVAGRFKEHHPDLVVIFISGAPAARLRELIPGGAEILRKPFTTAELAAAVQGTSTANRWGEDR